jgi:chromosome segregation ATPase
MTEVGGWNVYGTIAGFISAAFLLVIAQQVQRWFSKEQRDMAIEDRGNTINAASLKAQLDGWKQYSEQLTAFNTELSNRVNAMDKRLGERDERIARQDERLAQCEHDRAQLWRQVQQLGGTIPPVEHRGTED